MSDKKISQLPASTTPLAGTEVLPVVQGGATKQVSVANLTAGRAVSTGALTVVNANATLDNAFALVGKLAAGTSVGMMLRNSSDEVAIDPDGYGTVIGFNGFRLQVAGGNATLQNGNLVIGTAGKGIDFSADGQAAGMTSELLDDYEEGTWTPANSAMTVDSGSWAATGTYTKIGRTVYFSVIQTSGTVSASSGVGMITGFPFAPARGVSCTYTNSAGTLAGVGLLETNSIFYGATAFSSQTALRFSGSYEV
jgi:hypothetical protein